MVSVPLEDTCLFVQEEEFSLGVSVFSCRGCLAKTQRSHRLDSAMDGSKL